MKSLALVLAFGFLGASASAEFRVISAIKRGNVTVTGVPALSDTGVKYGNLVGTNLATALPRWSSFSVPSFTDVTRPTSTTGKAMGKGKLGIKISATTSVTIDGIFGATFADLKADNLGGDTVTVTFVPLLADADRVHLPKIGLNSTTGGTFISKLANQAGTVGVAFETNPRLHVANDLASVSSFSLVDGRATGGFAINRATSIVWGGPTDNTFYIGSTDNKVHRLKPNGTAVWAPPSFTNDVVDIFRLSDGSIGALIDGSGPVSTVFARITKTATITTFPISTPAGYVRQPNDFAVFGSKLYLAAPGSGFPIAGGSARGILRYDLGTNFSSLTFNSVITSNAAPNSLGLLNPNGVAVAPNGEIIMVDSERLGLMAFNGVGTRVGLPSPPMPLNAKPYRARFGRDGYLYVTTSKGVLRMSYLPGGKFAIVTSPGSNSPYFTQSSLRAYDLDFSY